jgi:aspartyl-tRNA(Asn)/glutamyl-tRNA(Gln) amidotransferase subunit C
MFTRDDVQRIATLARLRLTAEEEALFARQLGDILQYVETIRAVDTTGVAPTAQALASPPPLREDERRPSLPREEALAAAPDAARHAGLFRVPRVIGAPADREARIQQPGDRSSRIEQ